MHLPWKVHKVLKNSEFELKIVGLQRRKLIEFGIFCFTTDAKAVDCSVSRCGSKVGDS